MNAVSTSFSIFGSEGALASAASAAARSRASAAEASTPDARERGGHAEAMLAVLDHAHAGAGGACYELAAELRERYPATPVVVLLLPEKHDGAKSAGLRPMDLIQGLSRGPAVSGPPRLTPVAMPSQAVAVNPDKPVPPESTPEKAEPASLGLTLRQLEVLGLIAQGKPNKLICRELRLAEGTVKCHVSAILRALNVGSRTQAALKATRIGLGPNGAA